MGKSSRKPSVKKSQPFTIPTVEEVVEFMDKNMKDWPRAFCEHYGNKFWHSYNAKSWAISKYALMKSWESAFWARWADVPYPEEKQFLEKSLQSVTHRILLDERRRKSAGLFAIVEGEGPTPQERYLDSLDEIFAACKIGNVNDSQLRNVAEWLDRNNLPGVTPQQRDRIIAESGNDGQYRKVQVARQFFDNLIKKEMTVKTYFYSKLPQNGSATKTA
jgi:hypothetical protein